MTPAEEKFKTFFNAEVELVKDMTDDVLREHIMSLSEIAHEAKARLSAADKVVRERNAERKFSNPNKSIVMDDVTSEAINRIDERRKRLSKEEKLIENLMKLPGITRELAEKMISKTTQLELKNPPSMQPLLSQEVPSANDFIKEPLTIKPLTVTETVTDNKSSIKEKPKFTFVNPFGKK